MRYCNIEKAVFIFVFFLVILWFAAEECYAGKSVENSGRSYCNEA